MIKEKIVEIATSRIGIQEKPGNSGFYDPIYENRLISMGWQKGWAWCVFAAREIWESSYSELDSSMIIKLRDLFNPSAVKTYSKFKNDSDFVISKKPQPGDVVIWQSYKNGIPQWSGHAGIVLSGDEFSMVTVEGNSNDNGSREGIKIVRKTRNLDFSKQNGLNILGFIKPKDIEGVRIPPQT